MPKSNTHPPLCLGPSDEILVRAGIVFPDSYKESDANYIHANEAVAGLYLQVKKGNNSEALRVLEELAGNHMNKLAFNALNELGRMGNLNNENTRRGFAQFLFDAWKSSDREKLELISFWSFPSFTYSEYDSNNKVILTIRDEKEFVNHMMNEMGNAHSNGIPVKMRVNKINDDYVVDVMIDKKISTFSFIFGETSFLGIERRFE